MILTVETTVKDENGNILNITAYQVDTEIQSPVPPQINPIADVVAKYGAPFGNDVTEEQLNSYLDSIDATILYDFTKELTFTFGQMGNYDYDSELAILLPLQGDKQALKDNFLRIVSSLS